MSLTLSALISFLNIASYQIVIFIRVIWLAFLMCIFQRISLYKEFKNWKILTDYLTTKLLEISLHLLTSLALQPCVCLHRICLSIRSLQCFILPSLDLKFLFIVVYDAAVLLLLSQSVTLKSINNFIQILNNEFFEIVLLFI